MTTTTRADLIAEELLARAKRPVSDFDQNTIRAASALATDLIRSTTAALDEALDFEGLAQHACRANDASRLLIIGAYILGDHTDLDGTMFRTVTDAAVVSVGDALME